MELIKWLDFERLGDNRGELIAIEVGVDKIIPFEIKRVYYIYATAPGISRGFHAHRELKQIAICVSGTCKMILDNGTVREETIMHSATRGLIIESMVWREMHDFSPDCVLLVLASEHYEESDYIRSYETFIEEQACLKN
ncbi:sugar 3,4-ketoisomerase [Pseudomonas sp. SDO5522_S412]|jgi:dTDP-4-dehydrorhamnose 3,5-epimerase-like enzyme